MSTNLSNRHHLSKSEDHMAFINERPQSQEPYSDPQLSQQIKKSTEQLKTSMFTSQHQSHPSQPLALSKSIQNPKPDSNSNDGRSLDLPQDNSPYKSQDKSQDNSQNNSARKSGNKPKSRQKLFGSKLKLALEKKLEHAQASDMSDSASQFAKEFGLREIKPVLEFNTDMKINDKNETKNLDTCNRSIADQMDLIVNKSKDAEPIITTLNTQDLDEETKSFDKASDNFMKNFKEAAKPVDEKATTPPPLKYKDLSMSQTQSMAEKVAIGVKKQVRIQEGGSQEYSLNTSMGSVLKGSNLKEVAAASQLSDTQKNFANMRNKINTAELETYLRDMVTEIVKPIVVLAKKNLVHNALKNTKIHEIQVLQVGHQSAIDEINGRMMDVLHAKTDLMELRNNLNKLKNKQKKYKYETKDLIDQQNKRFDVIDEVKREMANQFSSRDKKIMELSENCRQQKMDFTKLKAQVELQYQIDFAKVHNRIRHITSTIDESKQLVEGMRAHLNDMAKLVSSTVAKTTVFEHKFETLVENELKEMQNQFDQVTSTAIKSNNNNRDLGIKLEAALAQIKPANERIALLEQFTIRTVPVVTQMQISDALQEFLCLPDQIKLIDYDNKKLQQLQDSLFTVGTKQESESDDKSGDGSDSSVESKLSQGVACFEQESLDAHKYLYVRLNNLLQLMLKKQQGCIRFEFGRDWSLLPGQFDTLEKAENIRRVPYGFQLKNKKGLFERLLKETPQFNLIDIAARKAVEKVVLQEAAIKEAVTKELAAHAEKERIAKEELEKAQQDEKNEIDESEGAREEDSASKANSDKSEAKQAKEAKSESSSMQTSSESFEPQILMDIDEDQVKKLLSGYKAMLSDAEERLLQQYNLRFNCGLEGGEGNQHKCGLQVDSMHKPESREKIVREIILVRPPKPIRMRRQRRKAVKKSNLRLRYVGDQSSDVDSSDGNSSLDSPTHESQVVNILKQLTQKGISQEGSKHGSEEEDVPSPTKANKLLNRICSALSLKLKQSVEDSSVSALVLSKEGSESIYINDQQNTGRAASSSNDKPQNPFKEEDQRDLNGELDYIMQRQTNFSHEISQIKNKVDTNSREIQGLFEKQSKQKQKFKDMFNDQKDQIQSQLHTEMLKMKHAVENTKKEFSAYEKLQKKAQEDQKKLKSSQKAEVSQKFFDEVNQRLEGHQRQIQFTNTRVEENATVQEQIQATLFSKHAELQVQLESLSVEQSRHTKLLTDNVEKSQEELKQIANKAHSENKNFQDHVMSEYVEFFRTKNKFTREWRRYKMEVQELIDSAKKEVKCYESKVICLMQLQPMVLECLHLLTSFCKADVKARQDLSHMLHLGNLPSDGYLMLDRLNTEVQRPLSSNPSDLRSGHRTGQRNSPAKTQASPEKTAQDRRLDNPLHVEAKLKSNLAQARAKQGLYSQLFDHRGYQMEYEEFVEVMERLIVESDNLCTKESGAILQPKGFFDDALLDVRDVGQKDENEYGNRIQLKIITTSRLLAQPQIIVSKLNETTKAAYYSNNTNTYSAVHSLQALPTTLADSQEIKKIYESQLKQPQNLGRTSGSRNQGSKDRLLDHMLLNTNSENRLMSVTGNKFNPIQKLPVHTFDSRQRIKERMQSGKPSIIIKNSRQIVTEQSLDKLQTQFVISTKEKPSSQSKESRNNPEGYSGKSRFDLKAKLSKTESSSLSTPSREITRFYNSRLDQTVNQQSLGLLNSAAQTQVAYRDNNNQSKETLLRKSIH